MNEVFTNPYSQFGPWIPKPWTQLLIRYADGRELCNCGDAYYSKDEKGNHFCKYGCLSNMLTARDEIAGRIIAEEKVLWSG